MPKRSRKQAVPVKRTPKSRQPERDENQMAFDVLQKVIQETEGTGKDPLAVLLGRRGGLKGGRSRVNRMTKGELSASASKAARARWDKPR